MGEKLDLFELSVKRTLEHHEMPLDKNAWNTFQGNLSGAQGAPLGGGSASFLSKFGLAAAVLTGAVLFINHSSSLENSAVPEHKATHTIEATDQGGASPIIPLEDAHQVLAMEEVATEISDTGLTAVPAEKKSAATAEPAAREESDKAQERITRINEKLQAAADKKEVAKSEQLEKRMVTRYVGTAFNLGAAKSFSPNNDGKSDYFLPNKLEANDIFVLKISGPDGNEIFKSTSIDNPWTGKDSIGNIVPEGKYAWEVVLQGSNSVNREIFRGTVKLER